MFEQVLSGMNKRDENKKSDLLHIYNFYVTSVSCTS